MQCSAVVEAAQSAAVVVSGSVGREDVVQGVGITALTRSCGGVGLCSVEYLMTASMQCSAVVEAAQSAAVVVSGSVGREDAVSHDPAARAGDRGLCLELISPPPKARAGVPAVFQISNLASVFFFRAWQRNGAHRGGSSPPHRAGPRRQAHSPIHTVPPCLRTNH